LDFLSPLKTAFSILGAYWWIYVPILLVTGTITGYLVYVTQKYLLSLKWVLLEIKPPPDVQKSPKIAENIFAGLHASYLPVKWKKRFFKGEVPNFYSFEIVGNGGEISFLIRVTENFRSLVEHVVFAQYPDAEIKEVEDYTKYLPRILPNDDYDLYGTDLVFINDNAYPLRTYPYFEEESGKDEFKRTDPLAPLAETLSSTQPGEHVWLQFLIRPTGGKKIIEDAQKIIDKITGKKVKVEPNALHKTMDFIEENVFQVPQAEKKDEKQEFNVQKLTPGQRDILEQVENKISKLGFKADVRFLYVARKELFNRARVTSVIGMFKQLYANNMNSFKPNPKTESLAKGILYQVFPSNKGFFWKWQELRRKIRIYRKYRERTFIKDVVLLNTEELATLWHLPGIGLRAPAFPRVEAKKGQPPAGLPQ
jgi:hypothetical protein